MNLILLGAPGSGKGTLAEKIVNKYKVMHISTGDMLRAEVTQKTTLGQQASVYMQRGELVPDKIILGMILEKISAIGGSASGGKTTSSDFILDGFPRNLNQAQALTEAIDKTEKKIDKIVYIKVDLQKVIERLTSRRVCPQCQAIYNLNTKPPQKDNICDVCQVALEHRRDDQEATIRNRYDIYLKETAPLVKYYQKQNKLFEIDGSISAEETFTQFEAL